MKKCIISILIVILISFSISPTYLFIDDTDKTSEIDIIEDKIITHPKINLTSLYLKDTRFIMPDHGFFSPEKYELNVPESFSFKFIDYTIDSSTHVQSGTFAVRPTQVIVKTSIPLINLTFQAESLEATQLALDEMYSWFTI